MIPYHRAQLAIAELKAAVYELVLKEPQGITNAEIGRSLGIYHGHAGHEGHISRTILELLSHDQVVRQEADKRWVIVNNLKPKS